MVTTGPHHSQRVQVEQTLNKHLGGPIGIDLRLDLNTLDQSVTVDLDHDPPPSRELSTYVGVSVCVSMPQTLRRLRRAGWDRHRRNGWRRRGQWGDSVRRHRRRCWPAPAQEVAAATHGAEGCTWPSIQTLPFPEAITGGLEPKRAMSPGCRCDGSTGVVTGAPVVVCRRPAPCRRQ